MTAYLWPPSHGANSPCFIHDQPERETSTAKLSELHCSPISDPVSRWETHHALVLLRFPPQSSSPAERTGSRSGRLSGEKTVGWRADSKAAASAYAWFNLFLRLRLLLVGTAGTKLTTAAIAVNNNISGDEDRNMNERYKLKLVPMQSKVRKRSVD